MTIPEILSLAFACVLAIVAIAIAGYLNNAPKRQDESQQRLIDHTQRVMDQNDRLIDLIAARADQRIRLRELDVRNRSIELGFEPRPVESAPPLPPAPATSPRSGRVEGIPGPATGYSDPSVQTGLIDDSGDPHQ